MSIAGCCSTATLEAARQQRDQLRAALVDDYDPDVPPASACSDVSAVTYDDMRRGVREGDVVAIDGLPLPGTVMVCTERRCTDACDRPLPCCNRCSSDLSLLVTGDPHARIALKGRGLRCDGYECAMNCVPFGRKPGRSYRFVGRYTTGKNPNGYAWVSLTVERFCHAPP